MSRAKGSKNPPSVLHIPPLEFSLAHALGRIVHILDHGGSKDILSINEIRISPRRVEKVYKLSHGQAVIVTTRKKLERPAEVDGVLHLTEGRQPHWLSHRLLEQFGRDITSRGWKTLAKEISESWKISFTFRAEERDARGNILAKGLRPAQIGGLHAIGAHWSLHQQPATVVMPTGTGKTETMLATLVAYSPGVVLVVVPSQVLRDQTAKKFLTLGLLRLLGNLAPETRNPIVGIIKRRPRSKADLTIFDSCNVLVSTMSALGEGSATALVPTIAQQIGTLIVDEAHHVGAAGWAEFRERFSGRKILQFTATPYRRDGKLVDGKVIYEYPLQQAQKDGYFKKISFEPVYAIDQEAADRAIAETAVARLKRDIAAGHDHLMMARCSNIDRATAIHAVYQEIAADLAPVIIHSDTGDTTTKLDQMRSRQSRIVVCVNMLGEGFDLPQLKVAAVHDTHKSLAVLLQFTGRFTRTSGSSIGDATVIANIADQDVSSALERLYCEDADWNQLLSEYSSEATRAHSELVEFLNSSQRLDDPESEESIEISHHILRPTFSTLIYEAPSFRPKKFFEGMPNEMRVHRVWLHQATNTLYFVTRTEPLIQWTRSREIRDRQWDLFVLHYDSSRNLLFLSSSDKSSVHEKLASAVGATRLISGDTIFRSLGRINRLVFQNVGVRKHGRRNLRFALYTGADVAEALSISERAGSVKSNLSGSGWENGKPVTIGCSYKGRIWSREPGTVPEFVRWCATVGSKLQDNSIDTSQIVANVLIPEEVESLPDRKVLSIDWPIELLRQSEERVTLHRGQEEMPLSMLGLEIDRVDVKMSRLDFSLRSVTEEIWASLTLQVGGTEGFRVTRSSDPPTKIRVGSLEVALEEYLSNYPPLVRFIDLSELDGNLLIRPQQAQELVFPDARFETWDWRGVDINIESIWKDGRQRENSIQWRAAQQFIDGGFDVVFDDDAAGEAADLVCLKEEHDHIRLALIHCKFTKGTTSGERVQDVVEVSSQAIRSGKWKWKFRDLCRHLVGREKGIARAGRPTRFLAGNAADLNRYAKISRFKEIRPEIIIVQPGLSRERHTADQTVVLAAAHSYLKETIGVNLDVICSS